MYVSIHLRMAYEAEACNEHTLNDLRFFVKGDKIVFVFKKTVIIIKNCKIQWSQATI
jgi:hypothetical protein